jgi:hypothetical protein
MIRSEGFLKNCQAALVERFCVGIAALGFVQRCQVVEAYSIILMCVAKSFFG